MRHIPPALMLMATLAFQTPASAVPMTFDANLTGAAEIPPTTSTGTGFTTVVIDPAANTLHVDVTFSGLTTGTTASHIHCCVASGAPGNFIVATTTPTFLGFPLGVTSGTYDNTLDLTQASSFNPAFVTDEGGVPQAEAALIGAIEAGTAYLNIHTTMFPGGEIRGILEPVPEPASLILLGSALFGFGLRVADHIRQMTVTSLALFRVPYRPVTTTGLTNIIATEERMGIGCRSERPLCLYCRRRGDPLERFADNISAHYFVAKGAASGEPGSCTGSLSLVIWRKSFK